MHSAARLVSHHCLFFKRKIGNSRHTKRTRKGIQAVIIAVHRAKVIVSILERYEMIELDVSLERLL